MIPFFPSLRLPIASRLWLDTTPTLNEEAEIARHEREQQNWMESFRTAAAELNPIGKQQVPGPETDDEANDDSDDSDSHESDDTNDRTVNN